MSGKQPVPNRHGQNMLVRYECVNEGGPLAIILHGFSGSMDEPHIMRFGEIFRANGFNTLMIDATNSFNEADGGIENASLTNHLADLEDALDWAAKQSWYREPFTLAGHSLGSSAALLYAETHPEKISLLFPASAVVSGALRIAAYETHEPDQLARLRRDGYQELDCSYRPGIKGRRYWAPIEQDWSKHDALHEAGKLTMPVLLVVGEKDTATPPDQQAMLYDKISANAELYVVPGDHCFLPAGLNEAAKHLDVWLKKHMTQQ